MSNTVSLSSSLISFASVGLGWGALSALGILYVALKRWHVVVQRLWTLGSFWFLLLTLVPFVLLYVWHWLTIFAVESPASFVWFFVGAALAAVMTKRTVYGLRKESKEDER